jgi:integrase
MSAVKVAQGCARHPAGDTDERSLVMGRARSGEADKVRSMLKMKAFPFTESRLEQARKAVLDGLLDTDESGRRAWRDADCRGLSVVVNEKTGTTVFYFVGKVNGQTARKALGDIESVRLTEARQAVGRLRFDRSLTSVLVPRPADDDEGGPADRTPVVKGVMDAYLDAHEEGRWLPGNRSRKPTDRTMKFYRDLRRAVMVEKVRRKRAGSDEYHWVNGEDFEALTLQAFADRLPAIHAALVKRAPVQGNRMRQLVSNVYAYAADAGLWSKANPVLGTGKADRLTKTPEQARTRTLSDAEWKRLDAAMKADAPLWRALFTFSMLTLQRMGACRHARWDDITLTGADAAWKIPAKWVKGRRSGHVVPLADTPQLLELLRARRKAVPKSCPWVFPATEGDGPVTTYKSAWKRILERSKLWSDDKEQRPRPHDLRRTGGERMTSAGIPLQTVTKALGDAPSSAGMVAKVYAQVADAALKDAYAAMSRRGSRRR